MPISADDEESLFGLLKNPSASAHLPKSQLYTSVQTLDELRRATMRFQAREAATWLVERLTGSLEERAALAARITLTDINWMQASGRLQWELDESVTATELREILAAVEQFCFSDLALHRLELRMLPDADKHVALAGECGFQPEGVLPAQLEFEGQWVDHAVFGKLASDPA
nr:GNAT family protein [Oceanobacter mangrovi]